MVDFVSVPSRGLWGSNLEQVIELCDRDYVSVPSRGLGGITH